MSEQGRGSAARVNPLRGNSPSMPHVEMAERAVKARGVAQPAPAGEEEAVGVAVVQPCLGTVHGILATVRIECTSRLSPKGSIIRGDWHLFPVATCSSR